MAERPDPLPTPVLLSSKVMGPEGSPDRRSLPVPRFLDPDLAVAAVERRVVAIRMARRGSLLVESGAVEGIDPERDLEWTARVLKGRVGVLVPGSVAVREPGPRPGRGDLRALAGLMGGDALEWREKPWYGFRLAETALSGAP